MHKDYRFMILGRLGTLLAKEHSWDTHLCEPSTFHSLVQFSPRFPRISINANFFSTHYLQCYPHAADTTIISHEPMHMKQRSDAQLQAMQKKKKQAHPLEIASRWAYTEQEAKRLRRKTLIDTDFSTSLDDPRMISHSRHHALRFSLIGVHRSQSERVSVVGKV